MKKLLQSEDSRYKKDEIAAEWKSYIWNETNLKKAITNMIVVNDEKPFPSWFDTSLVKLLLKISEIQQPLLENLLLKLNEVILEA